MTEYQDYECPECESMVSLTPCMLWEDQSFKIECPDCEVEMTLVDARE